MIRLLLLVLVVVVGCGDTPPRKAAVPAAPKKEPDGKKVNVAKNVWLEILGDGRRRVVVSGQVNMREGHLELVLTRKHGKEHEAILTADVDARKVHEALLLAGAEPGEPARFDPEFAPAKGPGIDVTISYTIDGKEKVVKAQEWVRNQQTKMAMDTGWVFAGSILAEDPFTPGGPKRYLANDGGDLIAVVNLPTAVLDLTVKSLKNPEERTFEAFTERIPAEGTPVVIMLTPAKGKS